jgi:hypothetical protein
VLYAPQVADWPEQKRIIAYSAVSYLASGAQKAALGTIKIEANTKVSLEEHVVNLTPFRVTESNFSTLPKEQTAEIVAQIVNAIPQEERVIALERVIAYVEGSQIIPKDVQGLNVAPPTIFHSKKPALIVNFDGDPIWSPIKENDLKFAVNTNWDIFQYQNTYYLRNNDSWLKATDVKGPWQPAGKLPESFSKLPADENFKEVTAISRQGARTRKCSGRLRQLYNPQNSSSSRASRPIRQSRARAALGKQHGERSLPSWSDWCVLLPRDRPMVAGIRPCRAVDIRDADTP